MVIPLLIIKLLIFVFFMFKSDLISVSREITYIDGYQQGLENDSIVQKKQRLIRIVRNEEDRGIIIKLRRKKDAISFPEKEEVPANPIVD